MNAPAEAFRLQALAKEIAAEPGARIRDRSQHKDRQGAWPRCAGIDPAERGRIDRIGRRWAHSPRHSLRPRSPYHLAGDGMISKAKARAAVSIKGRYRVDAEFAGSYMTATRVTFGAISFSTSSQFRTDAKFKMGEAGRISTWMRNTIDQSFSNRIGDLGKNDRDAARLMVYCDRHRGRS
jgi:hypothetical protein